METSPFTMPQDLTQKIGLLAQRYHSSPEAIMNEALSLWAEREERTYQGVLEGMADIEAGHVHDHEDVMEWFESLFTDSPLPHPPLAKK